MANWRAESSVRGNLIALIGLILIAGFATSSAISYQVSKKSEATLRFIKNVAF